jgi:hypothetical protein
VRLAANEGRCFQGPIPLGAGFLLSRDEAHDLLSLTDADYSKVVRPYLGGDDITTDPEQHPRRFIIDFGVMALEEAMAFPAALAIVRERVKPVRDRNRRAARRERWWRFAEPAVGMRAAVRDLERFIVGSRVGKRILFAWCPPAVCPSDATNVFAFNDDYAMGILTSRIHGEWARLQSSTLRVDIRYTPTSAFETFPWPPAPTDERRAAVTAITEELFARRGALCIEHQIGLTKLYNHVDDGAWADVRDLHRRLDEAVARAYGWPSTIAQDAVETNQRLLELNHSIDIGTQPYEPFGAMTGPRF